MKMQKLATSITDTVNKFFVQKLAEGNSAEENAL